VGFCGTEGLKRGKDRRECALARTDSLDDRDLDRSLRRVYNGLEDKV
jgi:hypothetical protein